MMNVANLVWVAEKVLNADGQNLFQWMLDRGDTTAAKSFLVAVLNDRILTGYSPNRILLVDGAEYYNVLELSPVLYPQQCRSVQT